jgi:predicted transcriptional regulator
VSKAKKAVKKVVIKQKGKRIGDNTIRILSFFRTGKTLSPTDVYEKLNKKKSILSYSSVAYAMYKLSNKGVLDKAGRGLYVKGKNPPENYAKYIQ